MFILAVAVVSAALVFLGSRKIMAPQTGEMPWVNMKSNLITVAGISANQKISSPVTVKGSARGQWFFEASFPVEVRDAGGNVLGRGIATAEEEWMTENFVPFTAEISFDAGSAKKGFLVLKKDNPSGEPQFDDELRIPVTF